MAIFYVYIGLHEIIIIIIIIIIINILSVLLNSN